MARRNAPTSALAQYLRTETIGGAIMLVATVLALVWANSPWSDSYLDLRDYHLGPDLWHLQLSIGDWAKDGVLALFFFVAGLELKRELVVGELANLRAAMLPVFAAIGGMVVPAVVCLVVAIGTPGAGEAWAVPVATDIAFALAVLAVAGAALPRAARIFLLSLAVVDDLGAIALIAILFTDSLSLPALGLSVLLLAGYAALQQFRVTWTVLYVPLAAATWIAVHSSGIHATVAGVAMGLLTRVRRDPGEHESPAERLEHRLQPWSAGFAVPAFALLAAGVTLSGSALADTAGERVAWAIVAGLLFGKPLGVLGGAALARRLRLGTFPEGLHWRDIGALGAVAGCGFTVSLLISELSFSSVTAGEQAKTAVLVASFFAAVVGGLMMRKRRTVDESQSQYSR